MSTETHVTVCPICDDLDDCRVIKPARKGWTRLVCSNGHIFEEK